MSLSDAQNLLRCLSESDHKKVEQSIAEWNSENDLKGRIVVKVLRAHFDADVIGVILSYCGDVRVAVAANDSKIISANDAKQWIQLSIPRDCGHIYGILIYSQAHDQGWSSYPHQHGTYHNANSFAELYVQGDDDTKKTLLRRRVYTNLHAVEQWQTHSVEILPTAHELDQLKQNRFLLLMVKFQYCGWKHYARQGRLALVYRMRNCMFKEMIKRKRRCCEDESTPSAKRKRCSAM